MIKEQVLKKVIEKAIKNGFSAYAKNLKEGSLKEISMPEIVNSLLEEYGNEIIWNHDFAKALWGEELVCYNNDIYDKPEWQYKLQQLAISEDRIKYLEKFI